MLVTGAAGFIASRVAEQLLDAGHGVVGVDNLNDAYDPRLKQWRLARLQKREGFEFHEFDVATRGAFDDALGDESFGATFHLAARAGVRQSLANPHVYIDSNVTGAVNALDHARRHDIEHLVMASTSSLYGSYTQGPMNEDLSTDRPVSPYAASKKGAEAMAASYAHLYGLNVTVPRYFTVYGPAGRPDMSVMRFTHWIATGQPVVVYGDGAQRRDFTYVDDIARGTILAGKLDGYEIVNLGGNEPYELRDMLERIAALLGRKPVIDQRPPVAADVPATWADISKAKRLLGWSPETSLDEGLARVVEWYNENADWLGRLDYGAT